MNSLYEIEYLYFDELSERRSYGWRTGYIVVYDTATVLGETLQHAFECASEDGDGKPLNELLKKHFGVVDDEVVFYFDRNGIEDESLFLEIQADQDMVVNSYKLIERK